MGQRSGEELLTEVVEGTVTSMAMAAMEVAHGSSDAMTRQRLHATTEVHPSTTKATLGEGLYA